MKTRRMLLAMFALFAVLSLVVASPALAVTFVDAVTVDTAPVLALATIVLTGLGAIWAVRKTIKLINRS